MKELSTPILFCFYKGLDNTKKSFETIRISKPNKIYLASDGPLSEMDSQEILEIRKWVLKSTNWDCKIKTLFRKNNLGVKKAISGAIDWVSSKEDYFFVIECDCYVHPIFIKLAPIISYQLDDMGINDYNICSYSRIIDDERELYFYRANLVMIWGWFVKSSTWKRFNIDEMPKFSSLLFLIYSVKKSIGFKSTIFWLAKMFDCYVDNDKTWGNRYAIHCMINNIPSFIPNLVICNNIGIGNDIATNAISSYSNLSNYDFNFNKKFKYQESILINNNLNIKNDKFFGEELFNILYFYQKRIIFVKALFAIVFGSKSKSIFKIFKPFYIILIRFFKLRL